MGKGCFAPVHFHFVLLRIKGVEFCQEKALFCGFELTRSVGTREGRRYQDGEGKMQSTGTVAFVCAVEK